ncbi:MAG: 1-acyl-sn-glycerol-3-phosphate acyltransferase [Synergistaceae bacterium]|nr:1-acyl-sn-glycerol-3-phosphate acyltransferase [Synergistaceae bacterium]
MNLWKGFEPLTFNKFFYALVQMFFRGIFFLYNRFSIKWVEPLSGDKNVIVACNHCSNLDPLVVGVAFPRRLRYFAKEELFRPLLLGPIIRVLGAVPVSRVDNASAASALKGFFRLLEEGNDVLIFPEGSRSPDGTLQPLEGGVGLIAAHSGASILPVFISGTYRALPPGAFLFRPAKISVTFGKLLTFDAETCRGKGAREKIVTALTEALRELESGS